MFLVVLCLNVYYDWLSFRNFFTGGGGKIYCYANFSVVSDQISGGRAKVHEGATCLRGPVEESQYEYL